MRRTPVTCCLLFLVLSLGLGLAASTDGGASPVQGTSFIVHATGTLHQGHTVTLSCYLDVPSSASILRPSSYVWVKDGKVIPGQTEVTLNLERLTEQDEGDYQCGAPDSDIPRGKYQLKVFIPGTDILPKPHIFQSGLPVCGSAFALDCVILEGYAANANTKYTWYKDSSEVKGESGQVLRFTNVTEADEGEYVCTAREGPVETTSPPSSAYYLKPLVFPNVHIKPASNNSVVKGVLRENLILTCEVTRAFPPVPVNGFSWSFLPSNQGQKQLLAEKSSSLTLAPLIRQHSGEYHCQARNDQDLRGLRLNGSASVTVDVVYLENISMTRDLEVSEGEPLTLTCAVDSHPAAHLTWSVNGKDVRHVTDNLDHYFIQQTSCSNTVNYTCRANNPDMPGQEKTTTTHVKVKCRRGEPKQEIGGPRVSQAGIAAQFDFILPELTSVLVIHPAGQVIITVHHNCSFVISSTFLSRCLHPHCDPDSHHLTFTLTQVTDKDEGYYFCREEKEQKPVPHCNQTLIQKKQVSDGTHPQNNALYFVGGIVTVLSVLALICLIIKLRRLYLTGYFSPKRDSTSETSPLLSPSSSSSSNQTYEGSHNLEKLYEKGKVYVIPDLIPVQHQPTFIDEDRRGESTSLLVQSQGPIGEEAAFNVKDLVRHTLQQLTSEDDLPSFVLHNTRLSREEKVILILNRKVGVVVMLVRALSDWKHLDSLEDAKKHLLKAKTVIEEKVRGLVNAGAITAVIALPNLPETVTFYQMEQVEIPDSNADVKMLKGREKENFRQWAQRLSSRHDFMVWDQRILKMDGPDTAFELTASKLLTLAGSYHPSEPHTNPPIAESWLLTPDQMKVRDSPARLLHIWGPPGSGKTMLLIHRARDWLADGKTVVIAVGREIYDVLLCHVADAVLREQREKTTKRLRVCRTHTAMQDAVKELRCWFPDVETCIIVHTVRDTDMFESILQTVESTQASAVWSVGLENLPAIDKGISKRAYMLGWESVNVPLSIRCTEKTVELLNLLMTGSHAICHIDSCSATPAREIREWEVLDHCGHPNHASTMYRCNQCKEEMARTPSFQYQRPKWSEWIALHTGDPHVGTDINRLCKTLQWLDVPASLDTTTSIVASHDSHPEASNTENSKWWKRVVDGVDESGSPTVHLLPMKDFISLEKETVLLVHWDERDNDPIRQSTEERGQRQEEHRGQWTRAVSKSKGQVIFLLLTPSPARSLLKLPEAVLPMT